MLYLPKNIAIKLIELYQATFSFDHAKHLKDSGIRICRYYPSCSEYTKQSISRFGLVVGFFMGSYRILRCNPFSKGGYDPVPERK